MDQLHRIQVEDILRLRVVPEFLMIPREAKHIPDSMGVNTQDVALHSQTVAIPADHLKIGLKPHLHEDQ
jgi:hypothetical protein